MSQVQSFGTPFHPGSQSRKMSIGVVVEPSAKRRPNSANLRDVPSSTTEAADCRRKDTSEGARVSPRGEQNEPQERGSPWITAKSKLEKPTISGSATRDKVIGTKTDIGGGAVHDDDQNRHRDESEPLVYRRKREKSANTHTGDEFPLVATEEPLTSKIGDKDENVVNQKSENLRMKLWELLGTVSSPNKEKHNTLLQINDDSLQSEGVGEQPATRAAKLIQNSDTIETDSESPNCKERRPVTRSATRKRASSKLKRDQVKTGPPSASRRKHYENDVFSFEEGWYAGLKDVSDLNSTCNGRKRSGKRGPQIEPCKTAVQRKKHNQKTKLVTDKQHKPPAAEKSSTGGSGKESSRHAQSDAKENNIDPQMNMAGKLCSIQRTSKTGGLIDTHNSALPDYGDPQDYITQTASKKGANPQRNPESLHTGKRNLETGKHIASVQQKKVLDKIGQVTDKGKTAPSVEKYSRGSSGNSANERSLHNIFSDSKSMSIDPRNLNLENDFLMDPVARKPELQGDTDCPELPAYQSQRGIDTDKPVLPENHSRRCEDTDIPALPRRQSQRGCNDNTSFRSFFDPQDGFDSPTFGRQSPIASHSLGLHHAKSPENPTAQSPVEHEHMRDEEGIFSFGKFTSKLFPNRNGRNKLKGSPSSSPLPGVKDNDAENSDTISKETCSEKSEEGAEAPFPDIGTAEKPRFMLHRTKRLRSFERVQHRRCSPDPMSPIVNTEINSIQEPEEQNVSEAEEEVDVGDGMMRAIAMLALALQKLKSKVKLLTRQKSSEILASVAERIQAQMLSVESQIQTDTGRLTSLSKQKRKRLEKEFQEQEQQLKTIHGNFKKEIGQLLEGCKGTIEGLQDSHFELKGVIDKQKTSHEKLIVQVEEALETQLQDAEKRITAINQSAREQMLQLKLVIAGCLKGGILS